MADGKQIWELQCLEQELSDTKRNADTKENTDKSIWPGAANLGAAIPSLLLPLKLRFAN